MVITNVTPVSLETISLILPRPGSFSSSGTGVGAREGVHLPVIPPRILKLGNDTWSFNGTSKEVSFKVRSDHVNNQPFIGNKTCSL